MIISLGKYGNKISNWFLKHRIWSIVIFWQLLSITLIVNNNDRFANNESISGGINILMILNIAIFYIVKLVAKLTHKVNKCLNT